MDFIEHWDLLQSFDLNETDLRQRFMNMYMGGRAFDGQYSTKEISRSSNLSDPIGTPYNTFQVKFQARPTTPAQPKPIKLK